MPFNPAEDYHQNYHEKNPDFYCQYRQESGRDEFIVKTWGKTEGKKGGHNET